MGWLHSRGARWILAAAAAATFAAASPAPATAAPAGSLDPSFGSGGVVAVPMGSWAGAAAVAVQANGDIVTAGQSEIGGVDEIVSTRMTPSGALDASYGQGGIVAVNVNGGAGVDSGAALALQPDGKIVIAGTGRDGTYGPLEFTAVRLNLDGTLDQSFGHGGIASVAIGPYSIANAVVIAPDGKILLGGTTLQGEDEFAAARLNADGTLDTSFGSGGVTTISSPTGAAWGMALQSNGDVVLAGQTGYQNPNVNGAQQFMAARLTPAGELDSTFGDGGIVRVPVGETALGFGVAVQSDGKLVLAGPAFTDTGVAAAVRLNTDGSLDTSYGLGGVATLPDWNGVNGIALDASGRAVLPMTGPGAVRFNTDGSGDDTFGSGGSSSVTIGSGGGANGIAVEPSGAIVIAGAATINGQMELIVARLTGTGSAPSGSAAAPDAPAGTASSIAHGPPSGLCLTVGWPGHRRTGKASAFLRSLALRDSGCSSSLVRARRRLRHHHVRHVRRRARGGRRGG